MVEANLYDIFSINDLKHRQQVEDGMQEISQEMFVHPLIRAVQELSAEVEALKAKLKD